MGNYTLDTQFIIYHVKVLKAQRQGDNLKGILFCVYNLLENEKVR